MLQQQYELDCKEKLERMDREMAARVDLINSQMDTRGMDLPHKTLRPSSSSSSRSRYKRYTKEEVHARTHCDCPLPIKMQVAWTITNPERRLKGCSIFDEDENVTFMVFSMMNYQVIITKSCFSISMKKTNVEEEPGKERVQEQEEIQHHMKGVFWKWVN
uniref:Uncharacterized protein n=1 Tax=Tanacetum cinerariifolium TaxID=118510 RepID=A0A699IPD7_TANCI|nr:hypothetical protein [Tanacetum cinerariifolium]